MQQPPTDHFNAIILPIVQVLLALWFSDSRCFLQIPVVLLPPANLQLFWTKDQIFKAVTSLIFDTFRLLQFWIWWPWPGCQEPSSPVMTTSLKVLTRINVHRFSWIRHICCLDLIPVRRQTGSSRTDTKLIKHLLQDKKKVGYRSRKSRSPESSNICYKTKEPGKTLKTLEHLLEE